MAESLAINCKHFTLWELSARNGLRCPSCGKVYPHDADLGFAGYMRSGPSEWKFTSNASELKDEAQNESKGTSNIFAVATHKEI